MIILHFMTLLNREVDLVFRYAIVTCKCLFRYD